MKELSVLICLLISGTSICLWARGSSEPSTQPPPVYGTQLITREQPHVQELQLFSAGTPWQAARLTIDISGTDLDWQELHTRRQLRSIRYAAVSDAHARELIATAASVQHFSSDQPGSLIIPAIEHQPRTLVVYRPPGRSLLLTAAPRPERFVGEQELLRAIAAQNPAHPTAAHAVIQTLFAGGINDPVHRRELMAAIARGLPIARDHLARPYISGLHHLYGADACPYLTAYLEQLHTTAYPVLAGFHQQTRTAPPIPRRSITASEGQQLADAALRLLPGTTADQYPPSEQPAAVVPPPVAAELSPGIETLLQAAPAALETCTTIITDLHSLRAGDILVTTEGTLAVVTDTNSPVTCPASPDIGCVSGVTFRAGIFSLEKFCRPECDGSGVSPPDYHARRIAVPLEDSPPGSMPDTPAWDVLIPRPGKLDVRIEGLHPAVPIHLPNTGIPQPLPGIVRLQFDGSRHPAIGKIAVQPAAPIDPWYLDQPPDALRPANIWRNSGTGISLGVQLAAADTIEHIEIARFTRQDEARIHQEAGVPQAAPYRVIPNSQLFTDDWVGIAGAGLYLEPDPDGYILTYQHPDGRRSTGFTAAVLDGAHPGDDFRLGFSLLGMTAHAPTILSIIDTKALWRAHAYLGPNRISDRYHWEQDAWGRRNTWLDSWRSLDELATHSRELPAENYTWISSATQHGAVAYDYDGSDTPEGFYRKLTAIRQLHSSFGLDQHSQAPGRDWASYLRHIDHLALQSGMTRGELEYQFGPPPQTTHSHGHCRWYPLPAVTRMYPDGPNICAASAAFRTTSCLVALAPAWTALHWSSTPSAIPEPPTVGPASTASTNAMTGQPRTHSPVATPTAPPRIAALPQ